MFRPARSGAAPNLRYDRVTMSPSLPLLCLAALLPAQEWRQFRGPNATGVSSSRNVPVHFGPARNVVWKTPLPPGKSSPVFAGSRIFLTAHEGDKLLTLAVDRDSGRPLWRAELTRSRQERRNKLNDAAAPTPVTDGSSVYSFFPDFGLVSYDAAGKERWRLPLPPMPSMQGVSASPLLAGSRLLLVLDQAENSYMLAVDTRNGETLWKQARRPAPGGAYSSPVLFGNSEFVTFSPFELAGFSVATGEKLWWVSGLPPQPKATPLVAGDTIFAYVRSFFGDALPQIPVFATALAQNDANHDGAIQKDEAPEGPARQFFGVVDRNKDGRVDANEWDTMMEVAAPKSTLLAIRPTGRGDLTAKAVRWQFFRNIPDVPTPLLYRNTLYMIQNGGILSALNPGNGAVQKQGRLSGALGDYYASPIAADGKIYAANQEGKVAVIRAGADWEVLAVNDMGEECYATPAIVDGDLYVRTPTAFYRFSARQGTAP
ncbi:MAG: PQQ-binding-like beta-propeller repeat protein [Bryobacterales bacterium]|nr:PQQ-binding-like beta-propeller repeat protein [Bryobacterales bacterium]